MAGFLFFVPNDVGRQALVNGDLAAVGLSHAATPDGLECTYLKKGDGPDGLAGVLCVPKHKTSPSARYKPAVQAWRKGPGGQWYVGLDVGTKPTPEDLRRPKMIDGEPATFRDGSTWLIPVARSIVRGGTLPKELVLGDDGQLWRRQELAEYLPLCRDAERVWELLMGQPMNPGGEPASDRQAPAAGAEDAGDDVGDLTISIDLQEGMRIMVAAMAVNYRLSAAELSLLRPSNEDMWLVLRCLCDHPAFCRIVADRLKKEDPGTASSSTAGGSPDSSPGTNPPSAT